MKKIIIVNNNMQIGGVQKSLHNLLWAIHDQYDVTLCLFSTSGCYMEPLPSNVKILTVEGTFRYLGINQGKCDGADKWIRGSLALTARTLGRHVAMKLMLPTTRALQEQYDCAIAFLQNGNIRNFYGGVQEFVLHKIHAAKKIAFIHCDYEKCGANHPINNQLLSRFDWVAACSEGCRQVLVETLPELTDTCHVVRNCHRFDQIQKQADEDSVQYDKNYCNVVMVSRISHEKGIERAIEAVAYAVNEGLPVKLHIVGGGPILPDLQESACRQGVRDNVYFYGEQTNPYRYMKHADLFLMTSYHEAAPMVIEEARCLGVPVLSTRTTSSEEMITCCGCGWVCENEQSALNETLVQVLQDRQSLCLLRQELLSRKNDNQKAIAQLKELIEL